MSILNRRAACGGALAAAGSALVQGIGLPAVAQEGRTLNESTKQRDRRMEWWRDARFGMFIHWGAYAVPAGLYRGREVPGIGEWIMAGAGIPEDDYLNFVRAFNPVDFNGQEWADIAKDAGMKYMVITSKHHDGFAMWPSAVSNYDIVDATPFRRDPMAELSRACKKNGIKFCFYYSILDWHHPSQFRNPQAANTRASYANNKMRPEMKADYVRYMKAQLKELIENYDPELLWFDGEWVDWWTEEDGQDLYRYVRSLKPELIVNNRVGKGRKGMEGLTREGAFAGDFGTPEQQIPPTGLPGVDWETCMTMNETWGYKQNDNDWKSSEVLIRNLIDIASKGGNFLLNVGPTALGRIPGPSIERLGDMGVWMRVNGSSIYGTEASPFRQPLPWGRATRDGRKLYLHVFNWPGSGRLVTPGLQNRVRKAYLLADRTRTSLGVYREGAAAGVIVPQVAPDPIATVVVLELDGEPKPIV